MTDTAITGLTSLAANPANGDLFEIVDVSDTTMAATGTNKYLAASYISFRTNTETLTNKTLTAPAIADFTSATHTHQNAAGGGQLDHGLALTGLSDDDHTQYLLANGTRAVSGTMTFTNGIVGPTWKPDSDSETAMQIKNASDAQFIVIDTSNRRFNVTDGNTAAAALLSTDAVTIQALDTSPGFSIVSAGSAAANRGVFKAVRARGTLASPTAPSSGDTVFTLLGSIYDGAAAQASGAIEMYVDGSVSSGVAPMRVGIYTSASTGAARTERVRIDSAGNVRLGAGASAARLQIAGGYTGSAWGQNGVGLRLDTVTHTDSSTASSGTATNAVANSFGRPTFAASNTTVTMTNAATLYIANAPAAGTNVTLTNAYALWVDDGTARFDGLVTTPASTTSTAGLRIPHGSAPTSPVDGDVWTTTAGLYVRINGATVGPLS